MIRKSNLAAAAVLIGFLFGRPFSQADSAGDDETAGYLSLEELMDIDVTTASKSVEKQSTAPGIIRVLTNDELRRFGGTTLRDVLERIPGLISSIGSHTNRSAIVIRGDYIKATMSHTLFLVNGRPVREIQEGGLSCDILNAFPVNCIRQIEVIQGPGSVLYGTDAFSGVINIITEKAVQNRFSLTQLFQDGGGFKSAAEGHIAAGGVNAVIAGQYYKKTAWKTTHAVEFYPTSEPPFFKMDDTVFNTELPDKGAGMFTGLRYGNLHVDASFAEWSTNNFDFLADVKNTKYFANAGYDRSVNDKWSTTFNITYNHAKFHSRDFLRRNSFESIGEWTNFINFHDRTLITAGGSARYVEGTETLIRDPANPVRTSSGNSSAFAAYAQIDQHIIEPLKVIAGTQVNKYEKMKSAFVPRVGIILHSLGNAHMKLLYSEAYRAPSINELYINNVGLLLGNENLKPEKVSTVDFDICYHGAVIQAGISAFYSRQKDIIYQAPYDTVASRYENLGTAVFKGGEIDIKHFIGKRFYFTASVSYQINNSGSTYNIVPISNLGIKSGISYQSRTGTVSLFNLYQGDIDDKYKKGRNPPPGAYDLLHFHSELELNALFPAIRKPALSLMFNIDNILDRKMYLYDWGGRTDNSLPAIPGRALYAGVKIDIK